MPAAVVADDGADGLWHLLEVGDQFFDRQGGEVCMTLECLVDVGHVGGVVLVVVDLHRAGVDVGLHRVEGVGQGGQRVGHDSSPEGVLWCEWQGS
jgi:hypothetical protein